MVKVSYKAMKEKYMVPELEIIRFDSNDVITASLDYSNPPQAPELGE